MNVRLPLLVNGTNSPGDQAASMSGSPLIEYRKKVYLTTYVDSHMVPGGKFHTKECSSSRNPLDREGKTVRFLVTEG